LTIGVLTADNADFQAFDYWLYCILAVDHWLHAHLPFNLKIYRRVHSNSTPSLVYGVKMHSHTTCSNCGAYRAVAITSRKHVTKHFHVAKSTVLNGNW